MSETASLRLSPSRVYPPARRPTAGLRVDNIGTISNTVNTLYDDVRDYPGDESYDTTGVDSYGQGGYGELVWPADRRWRPVAAIIGGVVALGAIATAVIINSGDSATTKATVGAPAPRPVLSTTPRSTAPPSMSPRVTPTPAPSTSRPQLPPETVTTLTPSSPWPSTAPRSPTAAPPQATAPPGAALSPRTVVYSVTGTKQLLDLVNVVYTDERGFLKTDVNVALPWTKVVVLNPGVQTESVIATSLRGRLNCAIVNAQGQLVVASTNNGIIATCTR
ncbi:putative transport accessory protein MmpS3 [Mycobacterium simulans]|uniref:Putative transport accessory protein MmpS3 n=1 Tax=Mycobacterium simulans TaxID=627089 RepID=A0A7Z7IJT7_9MYCO|nr:putative transport accessory protein MmpS3 [Mycobacterium simulans]